MARVAALVVTAGLGLVASQLLLTGLELRPPISSQWLDDASRVLAENQREGALVLLGSALVVVGLVLSWSFVAGLRPPRDAIVVRRRNGWTRVDCATLGAAIERELAELDRQSRVSVSVRPSGRVDVVVATPDPSATGPVTGARAARPLRYGLAP